MCRQRYPIDFENEDDDDVAKFKLYTGMCTDRCKIFRVFLNAENVHNRY